MSAQEAVLQRLRSWLKATADVAGPLADAQVIVAQPDPKGPRPVLPYLTVQLIVADIPVGQDEDRLTDGGANVVNQHTVGHRRATAQVMGFGAGSAAWLERAHLQLRNPEVIRTVLLDEGTGEGITVVPLVAGLTDVSQLIDTGYEPRYTRDYDVSYAVSGIADKQALIEATTLGVDITYEKFDGDPDAFTRTQTINL